MAGVLVADDAGFDGPELHRRKRQHRDERVRRRRTGDDGRVRARPVYDIVDPLAALGRHQRHPLVVDPSV